MEFNFLGFLGWNTYQIGYVGHLYGIVYDLGTSAAIALLEHRLIHNNRRLDIFGCLTYITLIAPRSIWMYLVHNARRQMLGATREAPGVQIPRIRTSLVGLGACLENHVRMFLKEYS